MGLIHLDAGVLIGFLDSNDAHHAGATATIVNALDAGDRMAMAASALAECLVGPARRSNEAIELVASAIDRLPVTVIDMNRPIATEAARLRARNRSLRLSHALVLATAAHDAADQLVTTDRRWPTQRKLKVDFRITVI